MSPASSPSGDFRTLRRPVLGHALEWDEATDRYRAILTEPPTRILHEGTLEECEEAFLKSLAERHGSGRPNLALWSLGGKQFWGDVFWYAGWRIQENVLTGHFRLLDPKDVRRAWGTREACSVAFEQHRITDELELDDPHLVVLLHGLGRTRSSLDAISHALSEAGFAVCDVGYPSLRRSLDEHAAQVDGLLDSLEDVRQVSFVTHSLGGLVTRAMLARGGAWQKRIQVGRLTMIAPPSSGSSLASALSEFLPLSSLVGPSARDLTVEHARDLPKPTCRFGIVAGARGDGDGWNPLVDGDDDGVVGLHEARIEGAEDFLVVRGLHSFLMNDQTVVAAVVRYLRTGQFAE